MGDVIQFRIPSKPKITKNVSKDVPDQDLRERIDRIKSSIARINQLMAELRRQE